MEDDDEDVDDEDVDDEAEAAGEPEPPPWKPPTFREKRAEQPGGRGMTAAARRRDSG